MEIIEWEICEWKYMMICEWEYDTEVKALFICEWKICKWRMRKWEIWEWKWKIWEYENYVNEKRSESTSYVVKWKILMLMRNMVMRMRNVQIRKEVKALFMLWHENIDAKWRRWEWKWTFEKYDNMGNLRALLMKKWAYDKSESTVVWEVIISHIKLFICDELMFKWVFWNSCYKTKRTESDFYL